MKKLEVEERIYQHCSICSMETEQIVIESTYTDTNVFKCTECQSTDEELVTA